MSAATEFSESSGAEVEPLRQRMAVTRCGPRRGSEDASSSTTHKSPTKPLYCARQPRYAWRRPFLLRNRSFLRLVVTLLPPRFLLLSPCSCLLLLVTVVISSPTPLPPAFVSPPVSACSPVSFYLIFLLFCCSLLVLYFFLYFILFFLFHKPYFTSVVWRLPG